MDKHQVRTSETAPEPQAAGSNTTHTRKKIFEQAQIARAASLKLGTGSPDQIELVSQAPSEAIKQLRSILDNG